MARLDWTEGLMFLCDECAIWERDFGSVIWIRSADHYEETK